MAATRHAGPVLVVSNGTYGERAAAMGRYHGVDVAELRLEWEEAIDPSEVARAASDAGAECVYLIHHETTTGRLNDLQALASAAREGRNRLVLVDAVSSVAGETLEVEAWGLDAVIGSANKCIRGVPGASFVLASERFVEVASPQKSAHYSNFASHLEKEDAGETPFTPGVPACFALRAALLELQDEGIEARIQHYRDLSAALAGGMAGLGFRPLLEPSAYGHTLLSYLLPEGHTFRTLHAGLKERGFVIYGAQGRLAESAFRLGLVGHFGLDAIQGLLSAMEEVL
jgi:2-aminoethylphosphonate-pyruvate transaminase